jgi:SNF2 family DNA or RNA helicase
MTWKIDGDRLYLFDIRDDAVKERLIHENFATPFRNCDGVSVHLSQLNDVNRLTGAKIEFPKHEGRFDVPYFTSPYLHQDRTSQKSLRFDRFAILSEMGTGKAKSCIDVARYRFANKQISRVLVLCPLSLIGNWQNEIKIHSGENSVPLLAASTVKRLAILDRMRDSKWYLMNYESVPLMKTELIEFFKGDNLVVLDEATKIKSPRAKRTLATVELAWSMKYALIATGNIAADSAMDIYCPFFVVDKGNAFGCPKSGDVKHGFYTFRLKFFQPGWKGWTWKPKPFSMTYFSHAMGLRAVRYKLKDCIDVPETQDITIPLELTPELRAAYDEMKETLMLSVMEGRQTVSVKTALAKSAKLREVISGFIYDSEKKLIPVSPPTPKLDALIDIVQETEYGVIVWCEFDHDMDLVEKALDVAGVTHTSVRAGAKLEEIEAAKKAAGVSVKVLITKPQVLGFGHTINSCPVSIYYSRWFWGEPYSQSKKRNLRIGQTNKVLYYHLIFQSTVDVAMQAVLDNKLKLEKELSPDNVKELL